MTKELYGKCRNPLKQAFCALDAETQAALKEAAAGGNAEYLHAHSGLWDGVVPGDLGKGRVYRISDKAAPEMTKELYNKCRNPLKQAFCALDAETQAAMKSAGRLGLQHILDSEDWRDCMLGYDGIVPGAVVRIRGEYTPPPEPRWVNMPVRKTRLEPHYWYVERDCVQFLLGEAHCYCDFDGITYDTGFVKLNPYNPAIGTPVSVRFRK